ncbi:UDP-glycosyltransferase [Gramella sp. BOM4]|nr:UDP-glycosyltransferase [Christiangramia bathymodioli]
MNLKKVLVIIPDGVSLRNFLFTDFPKEARKAGIELIYWNATPYDISAEGEKEIQLNPKPKALTDLYKRAKINAELDHFQEKFNDPIYEKYRFEPNRNGLKNKIKNLVVDRLRSSFSGEEGLKSLRKRMKSSERNSAYYKRCKEVLETEKPDLVFCANQRPVNAIAPVVAAADLNIPTACFIFSWDNLPKATKVIDTDYYFVWSDHMKKELLTYYPYIQDSQVKITGSPQFEIHYKEDVLISREEFYQKYDLDPDRKYLCFSGDDITTSPHDEVFLRDVAEAVRKLNNRGEHLGVIFRRCPVDFSSRYDGIIREYGDVIKKIHPQWIMDKGSWDQILPTRDDMILQTNIVEHSFMVINVGSSMIFDFTARDKYCTYIKYKPEITIIKKDICEVYEYVHFRSIPDQAPVFWANKKEDILPIIEKCIKKENRKKIQNAEKWFKIINDCNVKPSENISLTIRNL